MIVADVLVKCPSCGVQFNSRQLPIFIDPVKRDSELRHEYVELNELINNYLDQHPEPYEICTCPSCGNADWTAAFSPAKNPAQGATFLSQPDTPAHLQYRNAALAGERQGKSNFQIGLFYLYAAWCADDAGAAPQAKQYRKLAAGCLNKCLIDLSCPHEQRPEIEYLIGELYRRAGDFDQASDHLRSVIGRLPAQFALMSRKLIRLAEQQVPDPVFFEASSNNQKSLCPPYIK